LVLVAGSARGPLRVQERCEAGREESAALSVPPPSRALYDPVT